MPLRELIHDDAVDIEAIGAYLDERPHEVRWQELRNLGRADQRALYEKAADSEPLTIEHFVPASLGEQVPVRHEGRNTIPLPTKDRFFAKVFSRAADGERLFGYNDTPRNWLISPGYFVAYETTDKPEWQDRGSVVVDYFQIPDGPVPEGWPEVIPNSKGLQRFVYMNTRDFMRRVSTDVSIGAAYKRESAMDMYFVLDRRLPEAAS